MFGRQLVSILRRNNLQNCFFNESSTRVLNQRPGLFSSELGGCSGAQRNALYGFRSLIKDFHKPWLRNMSTTAPATVEDKEGLKLLVSGGPRAQELVETWLFYSALWVCGMVIHGSLPRLTRPTRSGLSMTDWKFTGVPLSDEDWLAEFEKYKQSPEYKRENEGMSLEDFKFLCRLEQLLRKGGTALGILLALLFSYFLRKGYITLRLGLRLSALFGLGAGQELIGWWMVKSGLEEPASEYAEPRVSPYRLVAHLTSAFAIYCGLLWTSFSVVVPEPFPQRIAWLRGEAKLRRILLPINILVGITAVSGAFVAANDAGHAYNTFPKMGDNWIPDDVFRMEPFIRNFFENTSTVQLGHRILATATLMSFGILFWWSIRKLDISATTRVAIAVTTCLAFNQAPFFPIIEGKSVNEG